MEVTALTVVVLSILVLVAGLAVILPVNIRLTIRDAVLLVEPRGLDVLLTLRRRIEVPLSQIISVQVTPRALIPHLPQHGLRLAGASVPGVMVAGSYGSLDERTFWDIRREEKLLMISCTAASPYRALVVGFADPYLAATQLRDAISS